MTIETANRLYELRKKHSLSQEELAEKLGVSRQAVSKWERSEASPDTDNLIALAKLYNLSLDELIYGEKEGEKQENGDEGNSESPADDGTIFIDVEKENKKVKIGPMGIVVENDEGETVKIGFNGIHINASDDDDDDDDDDFDNEDVIIEDGHIQVGDHKQKNKAKVWLSVPYPIICTALYLLFGCLDICGGWALSWIIFVTIPIYYSLIEAIYKRSLDEFGAYPVLVTFVYLYLGLYHGIWHPSWIIFLTIPIYYPIAEAIDRRIRARRQAKQERH